MLYKFNQDKVFTNSIEYSVAYHCNLCCTQCSHLSPFMDAQFPSIESFKEDLFGLSQIMHAKVLRLLGGEPLLNPDIDQFVAIAKKSDIADAVMVTTNGLLLHRMSPFFWENVDYVLVSLYPNISLKESFRVLKQRAKAHNTRLWFQIVNHFRTTIVTSPHKKDWLTALIYKSCQDVHLFHCHMIHQGMLYKCAVPPFLKHYLAKFEQSYDPGQDGFAIHHRSKPFHELKSYLTDIHTKEACRYCLGYVGQVIPHSQLSMSPLSKHMKMPITRKNNLDYRRLVKAGCSYFFRRARERITGEKRW
jgi:organic radical activating enzyme